MIIMVKTNHFMSLGTYTIFLYSEGVCPVLALKNLTKCWGYSKPSCWLTILTLSVSSLRSCWAARSTRSLIRSLAVRPVSVFTNSPKYLGEYGHENEMYNVGVSLKEGEGLKMRELRVSWEKMGDKTKCAKG